MNDSPSTNGSSARRWRRLLVAATAAVALLTAVAAQGLGADADHHRTASDDLLYRRLVNEGHIPSAPRDGDVTDVTQRLVNEGLIPRATR